ncbi:hypothetical protein KY321_02830 [Candidatus Woesearchaeota archaeon]|nr:hypothetical protein [Candidatus Woesearchaeota archaeon]
MTFAYKIESVHNHLEDSSCIFKYDKIITRGGIVTELRIHESGDILCCRNEFTQKDLFWPLTAMYGNSDLLVGDVYCEEHPVRLVSLLNDEIYDLSSIINRGFNNEFVTDLIKDELSMLARFQGDSFSSNKLLNPDETVMIEEILRQLA